MSAQKWNEEFESPEGSPSLSHMQDNFEYIIKKHEAVTDTRSIKKYMNKVENRITFKIKTGCYVEVLEPETMELLGSTEIK